MLGKNHNLNRVFIIVFILLLIIPSTFAFLNYVIGCGVGAIVGLLIGGLGVDCGLYSSPSDDQCNLCNNFNEFGLNEELTSYFEPCTEYRCRSLGDSCEFAAADNGQGICVKKDCSRELNPPTITGCEVRDPGTRNNYRVTETPNGCKIMDSIPEFNGAAIMLNTSEPASCRFSTVPDFTQENSAWFGDPNLDNLHFFLLNVFDANETLIQQCNAGDCNLYVKCNDVCDNTMRNSYAISFNIKEGPDLESPRIISTLVPSGALIPSGITGIEFRMNVFDQTGIESCKWTKDKFELYDDIKTEDPENEGLFECASDLTFGDNLANFLEDGIECTTMLRGLEDEVDNTFYLTCRDSSDQKNVLKPYVEFILKGTTPLNITSYDLPGGVVYDLTQDISVSTSREATCYSKINNEEREEFNNTGTMSHSTELELELGNVNLEVICQDIAGNEDRVSSSFSVEEDRIAPRLEQLYSDLSYLTIVLDEEAKCEYSDEQFNYGEGTAMIPNDFAKKHQAAIGQDVYYIKCRDQFDNELSLVVYP